MNLLKNFYGFIFLFIFSLTTQNFAQSDFEGKIVMKILEEDNSVDVDYYIKGDKMKMEMNAEQGAMAILFNKSENKTYMVMPQQKMYMEFNAMDIMQGNHQEDANDPDIRKTGEYMDINGYNCEKWIIEENGEVVEAWMTDKVGSFFMMNNPMAGNSSSWQQELAGNYFPMRVDMVEGSEKQKVLEVVSVNEMSLNNDLFVIPSGYQKLDMPNMNMGR